MPVHTVAARAHTIRPSCCVSCQTDQEERSERGGGHREVDQDDPLTLFWAAVASTFLCGVCLSVESALFSRVSSAVEQRFCKPLVGSSILSPGTSEIKLGGIQRRKSYQKRDGEACGKIANGFEKNSAPRLAELDPGQQRRVESAQIGEPSARSSTAKRPRWGSSGLSRYALLKASATASPAGPTASMTAGVHRTVAAAEVSHPLEDLQPQAYRRALPGQHALVVDDARRLGTMSLGQGRLTHLEPRRWP